MLLFYALQLKGIAPLLCTGACAACVCVQQVRQCTQFANEYCLHIDDDAARCARAYCHRKNVLRQLPAALCARVSWAALLLLLLLQLLNLYSIFDADARTGKFDFSLVCANSEIEIARVHRRSSVVSSAKVAYIESKYM